MRKLQAYKILGLVPPVSHADVKAAYRRLSMKLHPDKGGSEEEFKELKEAYEFFEEDTCTVSSKVIIITLEEAFAGCTKELDGNEFKIFPGISPGNTIGGILEDGTVHPVTVEITSEIWSPRWGDDTYPKGDLAKNVNVSPFLMITGGWLNIQTIESERKVYIAPGFQANHWVKVAQAGYWKDMESLERGDAYLRIIPDIKELKEYSRDELNDFAGQIADLL